MAGEKFTVHVELNSALMFRADTSVSISRTHCMGEALLGRGGSDRIQGKNKSRMEQNRILPLAQGPATVGQPNNNHGADADVEAVAYRSRGTEAMFSKTSPGGRS